jgi:hypothetical protein
MSGGSNDDAGFFAIPLGEAGSPGEKADSGAGATGGGTDGSREDAAKVGDGAPNAGNFGESVPVKKKRGRPPGSSNRPKPTVSQEKDGFGPGLALGSEATSADLKKQAAALAVAIQQRHLMLGLMLGIPELALPPEKAEALAIALINFQAEYPAVKVSRKLTVAIDLATAAGMAYLPAVAAVADKARRVATERKARQRPGVNYPPVNPQDQPKPDGQPASPAPAPNQLILSSGVPDRGKIDFGPN